MKESETLTLDFACLNSRHTKAAPPNPASCAHAPGSAHAAACTTDQDRFTATTNSADRRDAALQRSNALDAKTRTAAVTRLPRRQFLWFARVCRTVGVSGVRCPGVTHMGETQPSAPASFVWCCSCKAQPDSGTQDHGPPQQPNPSAQISEHLQIESPVDA